MSLSDPATVERFKALTTPVSITWLDRDGFQCCQEDADMAVLRRAAGATSLSIRVDAGDVAALAPEHA